MCIFESPCEDPLGTQRLLASSYTITEARAATIDCSLPQHTHATTPIIQIKSDFFNVPEITGHQHHHIRLLNFVRMQSSHYKVHESKSRYVDSFSKLSGNDWWNKYVFSL